MTETSQPEKQDPQNVYELMENDDGEVMVLLFAGEGTPQNPSFTLDETNRLIELSRSKNDIVLIEGLLPDAVEKLKKLSVLYVCEMKYNEYIEKQKKKHKKNHKIITDIHIQKTKQELKPYLEKEIPQMYISCKELTELAE